LQVTSAPGGTRPEKQEDPERPPSGAGVVRAHISRESSGAEIGAFRTAGLRNIFQTAPYMHAGAFATLNDVVEFYNQGGGTSAPGGSRDPLMMPLGLSASQKSDLVSFLQALTGDPIPEDLRRDTSAP
jgi:cytochrome c peroxidase